METQNTENTENEDSLRFDPLGNEDLPREGEQRFGFEKNDEDQDTSRFDGRNEKRQRSEIGAVDERDSTRPQGSERGQTQAKKETMDFNNDPSRHNQKVRKFDDGGQNANKIETPEDGAGDFRTAQQNDNTQQSLRSRQEQLGGDANRHIPEEEGSNSAED